MGTIIEFPATAASRRPSPTAEDGVHRTTGIVLILPVIRIERQPEETSGGRGPDAGAAPGRRRRRR